MLSAQVNEAYQALLRPLARAEYILGQNDMHVSELDQITDTAFMMEIMDSREAIDDAEDSSEVINLMEENGGVSVALLYDTRLKSSQKSSTRLFTR